MVLPVVLTEPVEDEEEEEEEEDEEVEVDPGVMQRGRPPSWMQTCPFSSQRSSFSFFYKKTVRGFFPSMKNILQKRFLSSYIREQGGNTLSPQAWP